jgi:hypothetical protein
MSTWWTYFRRNVCPLLAPPWLFRAWNRTWSFLLTLHRYTNTVKYIIASIIPPDRQQSREWIFLNSSITIWTVLTKNYYLCFSLDSLQTPVFCIFLYLPKFFGSFLVFKRWKAIRWLYMMFPKCGRLHPCSGRFQFPRRENHNETSLHHSFRQHPLCTTKFALAF